MHVLHTFANNLTVPYLSWFAERAVKEGYPQYSFLLMARERPPMIDEMAERGFPVEWVRYEEAHRKRGMMHALPWLWRRMRHYKPDIVHCNMFDDTVPGLVAAKAAGVPVRVMSRQDTGFHWMHARKWMAVDRWNATLATDIITLSREAKEFLARTEGVPERKLNLVHNGIPPEVYTKRSDEAMARLKGRFGTDGRFPIIGTVARFIQWKGYDHIVEAAVHIAARHPKTLFLFCGEGEQQAAIRKQVEAAGLQNHVVFTGWVDRQDIPSLYGIMDIYLHAAMLEPFGLVYPEAMMNGVPVVSTPTGAARDAIQDGINGILAVRSGLALAEGVERLLAMDLKAVGQAGKETALRNYAFEAMWNGTMDVYRRALKRGK